MEELRNKLMSIQFARNVWAEKRLSKLCPGNNIARFSEILEIEDTEKQFNAMEDIIIVMHEAYEVQMKYSGSDYEPFNVTKEMLDLLTEDDFMTLIQQALAVFDADGEVTVEAEPKNKKKGKAKSS